MPPMFDSEVRSSRTTALLFPVFLYSMLTTSVSFGAPERVGDFALLDYAGEFHQLSRYLHRDALVIMSVDEACEDNAQYIESLQQISERWNSTDSTDGNGVAFVLIDSYGKGRQSANSINTSLPLLEDAGQLVSESLNIQNAGEVLALDPVRSSLLYRGPAGSELETVLRQFISEGSVENTVSLPIENCALNYPVRDEHSSSPPDYASEVAPIIIENCAECHRQDGVGPFAMDSHIMVMGWSPMIREVLLNKRMPPTQVDPYLAHSRNARYVSAEDLQTVVHWIDAGAPRGEGEIDPLEELDFSNRKQWLLGEPDYIVEGPEIAVASTGVLDYDFHTVELPFDEDKWVRAVQYQAGDESVLHHLMTYVVPPDEDFWGPERNNELATRRFLEGYAPGKIEAVEFPADTGVLIPAGHKLAMQFHYVTNGRSTVDQTSLGLYFHNTPPAHEKLTQVVASHFTVPAQDNNFELSSTYQFDREVVVLGVRAHMHYRGKKMKFSAKLPGGDDMEIFSVPAYNYGWQPHYLLSEPVTLPAGSVIEVSGALDNTASNPTNPNPDAEVPFGIYSWEEMFTGYWSFYYTD